MEYQQFLFTITAGLQSTYSADEKVTVQTTEQKHTTKIKTVSLYHGGKRVTPLIYMAPFYRMHQHGYSMESIQRELKNVLDMTVENDKIKGEVFIDFSSAASCLSVRLIPYQKNQNFLKLVPHRRILDFAVVYQDHCRIWNVTEDILFQTAISSMIKRFPPAFNSVEALIGMPSAAKSSDFPHLFALTNKYCFFGASVILYPGVLRQMAKKLGGAYYILPSSVHEVLLLAKDNDDTIPKELQTIVREVNLTEAVSTDFLSNHVYLYDPERDEVSIVV